MWRLACVLLASLLGFGSSGYAQAPSQEKSKCTDLKIGPYQYKKYKGTPIDLSIETCLDGTAYTQWFHLKSRIYGTLKQIQKTIDAAINADATCEKQSDFAYRISAVQVSSEKGDADTQNATISLKAAVRTCQVAVWKYKFDPHVTVNFKIEIPVSVESKTISPKIADPKIEFDGAEGPAGIGFAVSGVAKIFPSAKQFMVDQVRARVKPLLDPINFVPTDTTQFDLYRPSLVAMQFVTLDDGVTFDIQLTARVQRPMIEVKTKEFLKDRGLE